MSRSYWRIAPAFWGDEKVATWNDDTRLLALYLLTCEHRTLEGLFRLPMGYIQADLGWSAERLAEPFAQLLRDGFIEYDATVRVCLVVNALSYQSPENPNQVAAGLKVLEELPDTRLFARLFEQAQRFSQRFAEGLAQRFPQRLGQPPALALALALDSKEEAAAVAREGEVAPGSSSNLSKDLQTIPGWEANTEDESWIEGVRKRYHLADIGDIVQQVIAKALAGTLRADARTAIVAFAKEEHEKGLRARARERPQPAELPPLPDVTPDDLRRQAAEARRARESIAQLVGAKGMEAAT